MDMNIQQLANPLLFALDGKLESRQMHVPVLDVQLPSNGIRQRAGYSGDRFRVVVEYHLELFGAARLVQQLDGEVLALFRQLLVLSLYVHHPRIDRLPMTAC